VRGSGLFGNYTELLKAVVQTPVQAPEGAEEIERMMVVVVAVHVALGLVAVVVTEPIARKFRLAFGKHSSPN